jgi:hypothetical protein
MTVEDERPTATLWLGRTWAEVVLLPSHDRSGVEVVRRLVAAENEGEAFAFFESLTGDVLAVRPEAVVAITVDKQRLRSRVSRGGCADFSSM